MNRNKKGAMPEITKKEYEKIKKSDRQEFAAFCEGMYKRGYEDGMESVPGVDLEEVMAAVARERGVDRKSTLDNIRDCVEQLFRKEDENE